MKIGFISTYFYPFTGGVEANCFYLSKELSDKHEVHIFTSDRKDNKIIKNKEEKLGNLNIHRSKTLLRFRYYLAFYPSLLKNLLKYDLDIVHVHSLGFVWHDICILIKKLFSPKTKFIITPHGPFMTLKKYPIYQKILKFKITKWVILTNNIYDKVIQVNPAQYKWLTKEYKFNKNKIVYLPNGIPKELLKKSSTPSSLKNKFILTFIGRLSEYKGAQDIIKILPKIKEKNLLLFIIGKDAGYEKELRKLTKNLNLENKVKFLTNCSDKEKEEYLQASEIFIMPSEWEAFGVSILESMAKSNAVISTNTEGGKFLIRKDSGLLYNFHDLKSLESCLNYLIKNNKIRKTIQENNLEKSKEFTWDKISKSLEGIYNNI